MNWKKRVTSFVLVVCMLVGSIPTMAFATEQQGTEKSHSSASVPFTDVDMNSWYGEAVQYVYDNHLMSGTSRTTFEPNTVMSRAMVVQILYNKTGKPAVNDNNSGFTDVSKSDWYSKAVTWAYQNGYASGVGNNRFEPNANVTREQFAQFMYNYTGKPETQIDVLSQFPDGSSVTWSKNAMTWAVSNKIINGSKENGVNYLRPQDSATRAQAAVILKNYCAMEKQQARFAILDLTVQGQKATVQVTASSVCTLTIQFLDENTGNELNTSATTFVPAGTEMGEVTADITGNMLPSHYKAVITLTDSKGDRLCNEFTSMKYTTAQEKFDAETVDDFPDKNVINFDEDKTDNFGVLADDVKIPTVADNTNIIEETSDDTYTVKNIDSSVNALGKGDEVLFYDENGEEVLVSIENIKVSGTTATITHNDDASVSDFYDVLKVDEKQYIEQTGVDMSDADDGVTLVKQDAQQKSAESGNVRANNKNAVTAPSSIEFKVEFETDHVRVNGNLSMGTTLEYEAQYDKKHFGKNYLYYKVITTIENKVYATAGLKVENNKFAEGQLDKAEVKLGKISLPLGAGFSCSGAIYIPVEVGLEGNVSVEVNSTVKAGVVYCSESGRQDIAEKSITIDALKADGKFELKIGPKAQLSVEFLKDVLKASFNVQMGPDFKAEAESSSIGVTNTDSIHACGACLDGKIYLFGEVKVDLTWKITEKIKWTIFDITLMKIESDPFMEFYVSLRNDEDSPFQGKTTIGWGECPNKKYKTTFRVIDGNGKEVKNISISIQRNDEKQYTAQSSKPIYLYDGEYTASCTVDNMQVQQNFKVNDGASTITLQAVTYIASGQCGDNLTWTLDKNGLLYISGTGAMYEWVGDQETWWPFRRDIKSVYIDSGVTTISEKAFCDCLNLKNVTIPGSVEEILRLAFWCCTSLENVEIQNGVKTIEDGAFTGCESLTNVEIPSSVNKIGVNPFEYCPGLVEVHVDEHNLSYCSKDGVLFDKEKTHLICYPIGKSTTRYIVPNSVTNIGDSAFDESSLIEEIQMSEGIVEIGDEAFFGCKNLRNINIPRSATNIKSGAFAGCYRLSNVYYKGNETEWSAINIDENNEQLTSATIHYNS
ncbi:MAG: leucine-rich repeat protein [Butyricicoccus sp.]|nr:leucine-rich repeat protein [Butyricicoccus sp.]MDY4087699.1 leucine-rich repeat protein [Butyricicoccus intestinisimiae]